MTDLTGRHALITGGGTGVGAAIARALAGAGARLTLAGRRPGPIEELAAALPGEAQAIACDVTDEAAVETLFTRAQAAFGPLSVVIANAGAAESAPFEKTGLDAWQRMMAVNLTGAFLTARAGLTALRRGEKHAGGRLIFIASTAGLKGYAYVAPYCAAKHGTVGLMRALAAEAAREPITVNAVCPGFTETPLLEESVRKISDATGRSAEAARADLVKANPQGRFVQPEEVAETVLWLCSPNAGAVTGQAISVSGGEI
jgi:NAD(P)-dependent dehydrogenase (short-subunit alcohol dehydrogenase family)